MLPKDLAYASLAVFRPAYTGKQAAIFLQSCGAIGMCLSPSVDLHETMPMLPVHAVGMMGRLYCFNIPQGCSNICKNATPAHLYYLRKETDC